MKHIIICLITTFWHHIGFSQTSLYQQIHDISFKATCRPTLVYRENNNESYSCACSKNGDPISYRITIDFSDYAKYYTSESFYQIIAKSTPTVNNLQYRQIAYIDDGKTAFKQVVLYDELFTIDGIDYKGRNIIFPYKQKAYSISFIATSHNFEKNFEAFFSTLKLQ